jgi:hypothetical protein
MYPTNKNNTMVDSSFFSNIVDMIDEAEDTELSGPQKLAIVQTTLKTIVGEEYERYAPILEFVIDGIVSMKKTGSVAPDRTRRKQRLFSVFSILYSCVRRRRRQRPSTTT